MCAFLDLSKGEGCEYTYMPWCRLPIEVRIHLSAGGCLLCSARIAPWSWSLLWTSAQHSLCRPFLKSWGGHRRTAPSSHSSSPRKSPNSPSADPSSFVLPSLWQPSPRAPLPSFAACYVQPELEDCENHEINFALKDAWLKLTFDLQRMDVNKLILIQILNFTLPFLSKFSQKRGAKQLCLFFLKLLCLRIYAGFFNYEKFWLTGVKFCLFSGSWRKS